MRPRGITTDGPLQFYVEWVDDFNHQPASGAVVAARIMISLDYLSRMN